MKLLRYISVLLWASLLGAQTHIFPATDTNNVWTGQNDFSASTLSLPPHWISQALFCPASGTGTAYTCTTTPSFTPQDGDDVVLDVNITSGANPTLAVNGSSAFPLKKYVTGASSPTSLVANDLQPNQPVWVYFDAGLSQWTVFSPMAQITAAQIVPLTGDVVSSVQGSLFVTTVQRINGGTWPTLTNVVGSNGAGQPIAIASEGNGAKAQFTNAGATTNGHVTSYDGNGNVQDSGQALPSGSIVGTSDTQTLSNKTLTGASSGNSVVLINIQQNNGAAAITGNSTDLNLCSGFTIPANTIGSGKGLHIVATYNHSSGTASVTYNIKFGGTIFDTKSDTTTGAIRRELNIFNNPGVQNAQTVEKFTIEGSSTASFGFGAPVSSVDFTQAQTFAVTFNVANTDQVTPGPCYLTLIQ